MHKYEPNSSDYLVILVTFLIFHTFFYSLNYLLSHSIFFYRFFFLLSSLHPSSLPPILLISFSSWILSLPPPLLLLPPRDKKNSARLPHSPFSTSIRAMSSSSASQSFLHEHPRDVHHPRAVPVLVVVPDVHLEVGFVHDHG